MTFLKQSLDKNQSIAIHYAIIAEKQQTGAIYRIISQYATLGDLHQFLQGGVTSDHQNQKITLYDMDSKFPLVRGENEGLVSALFEQCAQIAEALKFLHTGFIIPDGRKIKCAHMDLKPDNILIFEDHHHPVVGKWKLADFGISVIRGTTESPGPILASVKDLYIKVMDRTIQTMPRQTPATYQPPEVEWPIQGGEDRKGGRAIDIWSFGAVFAEVLAYARHGTNGFKDFGESRTKNATVRGRAGEPSYRHRNAYFYTSKPDEIPEPSCPVPCVLRHEVKVWLDTIIGEVPHTKTNQPCLGCWAACVRAILQVDPIMRPDAETLTQVWIPRLRRSTKLSHSTFVVAKTRRQSTFEPPIASLARLDSASTPSTISSFEFQSMHDISRDEDDAESGVSTMASSFSACRNEYCGKPSMITSALSDSIIGHELDCTSNVIVYLTEKEVIVQYLQISRDFPRVHKSFTIEHPQSNLGHKWGGIRVATPYIAVWGVSPTKAPAVSQNQSMPRIILKR